MDALKNGPRNGKFVDNSMPHDENMVWWNDVDSERL